MSITVKKRRSRIGNVLGDVKTALAQAEEDLEKKREKQIKKQPSIPSTEVGVERNDYGTQQKIVIKLLDPSRCRPWQYHNRDASWFQKERCKDLIESIQSNGQLEPGGVRKIDGDPNFDYEIIYGVRFK